MSPAPAHLAPPPSALLLAPGRALRGCVRAAVARNTLASPALTAEQRFNRFPAMSYVGITWMLRGEAVLVAHDGGTCAWPLPACFVSGPQRHPFASHNVGPIHAFSLVLYPEAFAALTGVSASKLLSRHAPLADLLDEDWQAMACAVAAAPDETARMSCIAAFLTPRWQACRAPGRLSALRQHLQLLGVQAAARWSGWSTRHLERRSRQLFGLRPGELHRLKRAETAWLSICEQECPRFSEIAQAQGYADQPHMTRELRSLTGDSPSRLHRRLREGDESYWVYRLRD